MNSVPNYGGVPPGAANKPYLLPKPAPPPAPAVKGNPEEGLIVNSVAAPVSSRVIVAPNPKPVVNSKPSQVIKSVGSKTQVNPQFIDPPEEFQFLSNKRSR